MSKHNHRSGRIEVNCPICGETFLSEEEMLKHYDKGHDPTGKSLESAPKDNDAELLISDQMTDEEIKKQIIEDMLNLKMHETGTSWMRLGTLLTLNPTDQMLGAGLKALIDQNKIIIRQNELMLRALKRNNEKTQT